MRGLFLVFVILMIFIYSSSKKVINKVSYNLIYVIGVYSNNIIDKKYASLLNNLLTERGYSVIIKDYDNYLQLIDECNNYSLDFAIVPEDYFIDSCLGLNYYKENTKINNQYLISLYFNYLVFLSYPFYQNKEKTKKLTNLTDLHNFKKVYNRNYIIGTEPTSSNSFNNMFLIFNLAGFELISIEQFNPSEFYNDNVIFYSTYTKTDLHRKMLEQAIDGLFILDIQNSRFVCDVCQSTNTLFMNLDLEKTEFDSLFSNYYSKKKLDINPYYTTNHKKYFSKDNISPKDTITYYNINDIDESIDEPVNKDKGLKQILNNLGEFDTRSIRNVLITNDKTADDVAYNMVDLIIRNNNYIINKLVYNKFSNSEHKLFEPIDITYIDKNIKYHPGVSKLYKELGFITYDKLDLKKNEADADEKYNYYWNYSKIGLNRFKFDD